MLGSEVILWNNLRVIQNDLVLLPDHILVLVQRRGRT